MKKLWNWIKNLFRKNAGKIDKFSEKLFAKGVDELVLALKNTLPKTKKALMLVIKKNFVAKFKNVPFVNDKLDMLFKQFEKSVSTIKVNKILTEFAKFIKREFNDLYKPEGK